MTHSDRTPIRAIAAAAVGNMLEWYDFTVYALFAGYLAQNFFGGGDAANDLLKAFLAFGLGFTVRPLGAVLIGQYGDRRGRKAALTLTILLMAAGTGIIAFAPGRAAIGWGAPILLLLGRILQGFSAGGEIGGAAAYLLETAQPHRRGVVTSWLEASMGLSNILGALAAFAVSAGLSAAAVHAWGWRLPFIFGLAILPIGLILRRSLPETGAFRDEALKRRIEHGDRPAPLVEVLRDHGRTLCVGFGVAVLWAVAVYTLVIFLPVYVQGADGFDFTAKQAFGASLIGNVLFVVGCVAFGSLSDRIGRRTMLFISATLLLLGVLPAFEWLRAEPSTATLIAVQCALCILVASFVGVAPAALAEIFPTRVRATGMSIVYNSAFMIFGGFAPAILTWFKQRPDGSRFAPAWYVMAAAVVALAAIPALERSEP